MIYIDDEGLRQLLCAAVPMDDQLVGKPIESLKLLVTPEKKLLRIIHPPKKQFTSKRLWSTARRFKFNAKKLKQRGVVSSELANFYYHRSSKSYILEYPFIPGEDVRSICQRDGRVLSEVSVYLADLHSRGVFFRLLHCGNIVKLQAGGFGLIDIGRVGFSIGSLGVWRRARNLRRLFDCKEDQFAIKQFGIDRFVRLYFKAAKLSGIQEACICWYLRCHGYPIAVILSGGG